MVWAAVVAANGDTGDTDTSGDGIVDERAFYRWKSGVDHPLVAEDYLAVDQMRSMLQALETAPAGSVLLSTADPDFWAVAPPDPAIPPRPSDPRATVYFINLGMTSMLTDLDVRVLDPMGLAYPLASHTERIEGGRIGHDKFLFPDWVLADSGAVSTPEAGLPFFLSEQWVEAAQTALTCPETQELLRSYRAPLSTRLFARNLLDAFRLAAYRIDGDPFDEVERCELSGTNR
jgi:arabinofuranosyltransferase